MNPQKELLWGLWVRLSLPKPYHFNPVNPHSALNPHPLNPNKGCSDGKASGLLLGGSGVVVSGVISPLIGVISIVTLVITLLITKLPVNLQVASSGQLLKGFSCLLKSTRVWLLQGLYAGSIGCRVGFLID